MTPEQGRTEYEYNRDGSSKTVTDARGAKSNFSYDSRYNLKGVTYTAPEGVALSPTVTYGYTAENRREWMQDELGRVEYRYDERGRLKQETRRFKDLPNSAYTLSYEYDVAGSLQNVSTSWGEKVGYKHDRSNSLVTMLLDISAELRAERSTLGRTMVVTGYV